MNFTHFGYVVFDDSTSIAKGKRGLVRESEGQALELRRQVSFANAISREGEVTYWGNTVNMQVHMYPTGNCQVASFAYINRFFGHITPEKVANDITRLKEVRLLLKKLLIVSSISIFDNTTDKLCYPKPMVLVDYKDFGSNEATVNLLFGTENRVIRTPYVSTNGSHMVLEMYKTDIFKNVPILELELDGTPSQFNKEIQNYLNDGMAPEVAKVEVPQPIAVHNGEPAF